MSVKTNLKKLEEELNKSLSAHPHIFGGEQLNLDEWKIQKEPYQWILEDSFKENDDIVELWQDYGYGYMILVINGKIDSMCNSGFIISSCNRFIGINERYGSECDECSLYKKIKPSK